LNISYKLPNLKLLMHSCKNLKLNYIHDFNQDREWKFEAFIILKFDDNRKLIIVNYYLVKKT